MPILFEKELVCVCCNQVVLNYRSIQLLKKINSTIGGGMQIISGYRCIKQNRIVRESPTMFLHVLGLAADIKHPIFDDEIFGTMIYNGYIKGFLPELGNIQVYNEWVHIDVAIGRS
jgi:hypothetical protein